MKLCQTAAALLSLPAAVPPRRRRRQLPRQPTARRCTCSCRTSETGLDPAVASDIAIAEPAGKPVRSAAALRLPGAPGQAARKHGGGHAGRQDGGLTYTFKIRPGIYFTPDPAFKGAQREVTAADYVYSLKRLYDPALKSPWLSLFEGKIAGDAALQDKFSYDAPFAGLQAPDRYTLRIRLSAPDNNFLFYLATPASGVVAREVVEAYPGQVGNHPVGTGPFMIGEWKRSDKIVLLANPRFARGVPRHARRRRRPTRPSPPPSRASACRWSTASKSRSPRNSRAACWASWAANTITWSRCRNR